jgi:hypothetical protein
MGLHKQRVHKDDPIDIAWFHTVGVPLPDHSCFWRLSNCFRANSALEMKLSHVAAIALISAASANVTDMGQDTIVAQGLFKPGQHIGANGYPEPKTCTVEKARGRREWYLASARVRGLF